MNSPSKSVVSAVDESCKTYNTKSAWYKGLALAMQYVLASGRRNVSPRTDFIITIAVYKTPLLRQTTLNCS